MVDYYVMAPFLYLICLIVIQIGIISEIYNSSSIINYIDRKCCIFLKGFVN